MKVDIALTPSDWSWHWYREEGYLSFAIGPIFIQLEWLDEGRIGDSDG